MPTVRAHTHTHTQSTPLYKHTKEGVHATDTENPESDQSHSHSCQIIWV